MYKRDIKVNGYLLFIRSLHYGKLKRIRVSVKRQSQGTGENPGWEYAPCPPRDGRMLASPDTPCPKLIKSQILHKRSFNSKLLNIYWQSHHHFIGCDIGGGHSHPALAGMGFRRCNPAPFTGGYLWCTSGF